MTITEQSSRTLTLSESGFILDLTGITNGIVPDGHLWHSVRASDGGGTWSAFQDVETTAGETGSIEHAAITVGTNGPRIYGTHILAVDGSGGLRRTFRQQGWPTFAPFEDVKAKVGSDPGQFLKVAAANLSLELHVCGLTSDGLLYHTIRHNDGSWEPFFDIGAEAGDIGLPVQVACVGYQRDTSPANGLQLFVVSSDGRVWSSTRRQADGRWTPFIEITRTGRAGKPGLFVNVDCLAVTGARQVHVTGVTDDGRLYYAIRREDSTWKKPFSDVEATAGNKGPFTSAAGATYGSNGASVAATSGAGMWLTSYDERADKFTPFQDVTAEAGAQGIFTSVALEGQYIPG